MNELFGILKATLEEGFVYAILAYGVYITYSILDFPDLSVDGTVPLGAVLTGVLILQGFNPWLCVLFSFVVGALAGCVTGLLNVKLKIRPLLCGILVMTALLSINLVLVMKGTGGLSLVSFFTSPTIFSSAPEREVQVNVDPAKLDAYNLTVEQLGQIIAAENVNIPSGTIDIGNNTLTSRPTASSNSATSCARSWCRTPGAAR